MQKVTFDVVSRPTNEAVGVTNVNNVTFDSEGAVTETVLIGTVTTARGTGTYQATVNKDGNATSLDGDFTSRSQAGHAIQREFFADVRAEAEQARALKAERAAAERDAKAVARAKAKAEKAAAKAEADALKAAEKEAKAVARAEAKAAREAAKAEKAKAAAEAKAAKAAAKAAEVTETAEVVEG